MWLLLLVFLVTTFLSYVKWCQTYWQRNGVPSPAGSFFFGHFKSALLGQTSFGETILQIYQQGIRVNSKHVGVYFLWQPIYVPLEPELVKQILVKDFSYFVNRGTSLDPAEILSMNLFNIKDEHWRRMRTILTPTFTSSKTRMMFETIMEKAVVLDRVVDAECGSVCDISSILARFTTDVITSCAFGIEGNSLNQPDSPFRDVGRKAFEEGYLRFWAFRLLPLKLLNKLGFEKYGTGVRDFFCQTIRQTIREREEKNIFRKDFMHLLLEIKNKEKSPLSENDIIAQCFVFFAGGFETSATAVTFAMLELAQNDRLQTKLREHINEVLLKHGGEFTYDALMDMKYLENVLNESLRKYPPGSVLFRVCKQDYKVPETEIVIKKGTMVFVNVWGLQRDPKYYPDPEKFDPDRFEPENVSKRVDFTFLPFGEGPRMCIAFRFGMLQSKLGLATLIRNFKFTLNEKTSMPVRMQIGNDVNTVDGHVWLNVSRVK